MKKHGKDPNGNKLYAYSDDGCLHTKGGIVDDA